MDEIMRLPPFYNDLYTEKRYPEVKRSGYRFLLENGVCRALTAGNHLPTAASALERQSWEWQEAFGRMREIVSSRKAGAHFRYSKQVRFTFTEQPWPEVPL